MKNSLLDWNRFKGSFIYAWSGIWQIFRKEQNLWIILIIGVAVIVLSWILGLSTIEKVIIILISAAVVSAEILNTTVEFICDNLNLADHNRTITILKNIMAGFVLIWSIAALVIGIIIFWPHIS